MRYGRKDDLFVVQPGDRGRTGTRRRLLVRLGRETTTTSSLAWCLIGRQSSWLLASLFLWVLPSSPFPSICELLSSAAHVYMLPLPLSSSFSSSFCLCSLSHLLSPARMVTRDISVSLCRTSTVGLDSRWSHYVRQVSELNAWNQSSQLDLHEGLYKVYARHG